MVEIAQVACGRDFDFNHERRSSAATLFELIVAAVQDAQVGYDVPGALWQEYRDWLPGGGSALENQRGAILGEPLDLPEGELAVLFYDRHFVCAFKRSSFFKVFDDVYLHVGKGAAIQYLPLILKPDAAGLSHCNNRTR